jgi:hypothetical protein
MLLVSIIIISLFSIEKKSFDVAEVLSQEKINYNVIDDNLISIDCMDVDDVLGVYLVNVDRRFYVSDRLVIEGYSPLICGYRLVDGKRVNIQVSFSDNGLLIGSPLIESSF